VPTALASIKLCTEYLILKPSECFSYFFGSSCAPPPPAAKSKISMA
jgi:hypothetical protein